MKKLFLLTTIVFLLFSCKEETTKTIYYKTSKDGKALSLLEFNTFKDKLETKFKAISDDVIIDEILTDSIVSFDSIIKTYKLDIKIGMGKEEVKKEKIFNFLNKKLPSEILYSIDGQKVNLNTLIGKPMVLNFWFTTCKPCIDEMPVLNKLMEKYGGKVNFISIAYEDEKSVKHFFKTHQFDYLKVVGAQNFVDKLGIEGFPKNIFFDKNGIVKRIESGIPYILENDKLVEGDGKEFEKYIEELL